MVLTLMMKSDKVPGVKAEKDIVFNAGVDLQILHREVGALIEKVQKAEQDLSKWITGKGQTLKF